MIRVFNKALDAASMYRLQKRQYAEKLLMSGTVPANSSTYSKTTVSNLGHFLCLFVTGRFTTLDLITDAVKGAQVIDTGISYLRGQLVDGAGQKKLFSDFTPLDLFLSPGRMRAGTTTIALGSTYPVTNTYLDNLDYTATPTREIALASAKGETLFYPQEFEYLFSANSEIQMEIKNSANCDNSFDIVFHGIRILSGAAVRGVQ